jgi:hypothetical protein
MKEEVRWKVYAALMLITLSLGLYLVHFLVFHDSHHILIYLVGDLAFIPIEVLIVTLIIDGVLESREKAARAEKLNIVIGTFFSTTGIPLLKRFFSADPDAGEKIALCQKAGTVPGTNIASCLGMLTGGPHHISIGLMDLGALRDNLCEKENFMILLLENPMVFEHESFTDLLFSIHHLTEELRARESILDLPEPDLAHLEKDMERVYSLLIPEWSRYMGYLMESYPYLFSLAMRQNPFNPSASVVINSAQ